MYALTGLTLLHDLFSRACSAAHGLVVSNKSGAVAHKDEPQYTMSISITARVSIMALVNRQRLTSFSDVGVIHIRTSTK